MKLRCYAPPVTQVADRPVEKQEVGTKSGTGSLSLGIAILKFLWENVKQPGSSRRFVSQGIGFLIYQLHDFDFWAVSVVTKALLGSWLGCDVGGLERKLPKYLIAIAPVECNELGSRPEVGLLKIARFESLWENRW
jgi:hypothetical protein